MKLPRPQRRTAALALLVVGGVATALAALARAEDASSRLAKVAELEWARDVSVKTFLTDEDASVRRVAARALGRIAAPGDEIATAESANIASLLIERLKDEKDEAVRHELMAGLGFAGTPAAARALIAIRDRDATGPDVGFAACALRLAAQESERADLVRGLESRRIAGESALALGILERRRRAAGDATIDTATRTALLARLAAKHARALGGQGTSTEIESAELYPFVFALSALGDSRPDAREALAEVLASSKNADARAEAARGLARSARADSPLPPELLRDDDDPRVATELVHALAKYKHALKARDRLVELLAKHPSFHARRAAAEALAARAEVPDSGEVNAVEVTALVKALDDPYTTVRAAALLALATRDPARARATAKTWLTGGDKATPAARMAAARALAALSAHAADAGAKSESIRIVKELAAKDPDHRVRMAALDALGEHGDDATVVALASDRVARDDDPGIFETAADLLARKGGADAEPGLLAGYERTRERHEFFEARETIVTALAERGEKLTAAGRKLLERAASDPDASVAAAAAKALGSAKKLAPRPRRKPAVTARDWGQKTPVLAIQTSRGSFEVELFPDLAPLHVANVVTLAEKKFYDGLTWHRVVSDFVIQGGCPRGDGSGDPGYTIPDELTLEPYTRGTLGMPKTATKDTGGCQLFFTHGRTPHLEGRYTVFGRIRKGSEVMDRIEEGDAIESVKVLVVAKESR